MVADKAHPDINTV